MARSSLPGQQAFVIPGDISSDTSNKLALPGKTTSILRSNESKLAVDTKACTSCQRRASRCDYGRPHCNTCTLLIRSRNKDSASESPCEYNQPEEIESTEISDADKLWEQHSKDKERQRHEKVKELEERMLILEQKITNRNSSQRRRVSFAITPSAVSTPQENAIESKTTRDFLRTSLSAPRPTLSLDPQQHPAAPNSPHSTATGDEELVNTPSSTQMSPPSSTVSSITTTTKSARKIGSIPKWANPQPSSSNMTARRKSQINLQAIPTRAMHNSPLETGIGATPAAEIDSSKNRLSSAIPIRKRSASSLSGWEGQHHHPQHAYPSPVSDQQFPRANSLSSNFGFNASDGNRFETKFAISEFNRHEPQSEIHPQPNDYPQPYQRIPSHHTGSQSVYNSYAPTDYSRWTQQPSDSYLDGFNQLRAAKKSYRTQYNSNNASNPNQTTQKQFDPSEFDPTRTEFGSIESFQPDEFSPHSDFGAQPDSTKDLRCEQSNDHTAINETNSYGTDLKNPSHA